VTDPDHVPQTLAARLAAFYNLTPAEHRLVRTLATGVSLAQAAELLKLSRDTLKTQLRRVFDKTGTQRQSQLMALVARLTTIR